MSIAATATGAGVASNAAENPMWPQHEDIPMGSQASAQSTTLATAMDMPQLRQSTRTRKPTQKKEESVSAPQPRTKASNEAAKADVFCLCRKGDDGKPMVYCAECRDWFHFRCVGLTKKTASELSVFACPPCFEKTGKTSQSEHYEEKQSPESLEATLNRKLYNLTSAATDAARDAKIEDSPANVIAPPESSTSVREPTSALKSPKRKREGEESSPKRTRAPSAPEESQQRASMSAQQPFAAPRKTAASPSSHSPLPTQSTRKTSQSKEAPASGSAAAQRVRSDALRRHATEQFTSVFRDMFVEAHKGTDEESHQRAQKYADTFESALFAANGGSTTGKSSGAERAAGKEYRDKLRTFLFNLKDKGNQTLRFRITSGEIDATRLATMTNEELANDEIRKEIEKRKRENLEQSILKRDDKVPLRKVTHKGEIDIEVDAPPAFAQRENEYYSRDVDRSDTVLPDKAVPAGKSESPAKNMVAKSPTPRSQASSSPDPNQLSPESRLRENSTTTSFDFNNVWSGDGPANPANDGDDGEHVNKEANDEGVSESANASTAQQDSESSNVTGAGADNFIDNFLGMPEGTEKTNEQGGDASVVQPGPQDHQESDMQPIKWRGSINMPDEGAFTCAVKQVAGRLIEDMEWKALFPNPHALIEGRLPSDVAMPYLLQSQLAARTELIAFSMDASWEPDAVPAALSSTLSDQEASQKAFDRLLRYFHGRGRYGVVQCDPAARGRLVKDFYVSALPRGETPPEWLVKMDATRSGNDRFLQRDHDCFILVAVLFRPSSTRRSAEGTSSQSPSDNQEAAKGHGQPSIPPLSANIASALAPGSSTLQDLLKAVGGGAGAFRSPAQGTPAFQSPPPGSDDPHRKTVPIAAASQQGLPSASQMQALSEMPKPQLEDILTKNPSLVDNLLKALGNGRVQANAGAEDQQQPPPPGPPPPRPPVAAVSTGPPNSGGSYGMARSAQQDYRGFETARYGPSGNNYVGNYGNYTPEPQQQYGAPAQPMPPHLPHAFQYPPQQQYQNSAPHFGARPPPSGPSGRGRGGYRGRGRGRY